MPYLPPAGCAHVLALCLLLATTGARAEHVMLKTGPDTFGQGWLFVDPEGQCRVATPAHVVGRGAELADALVIDQRGREFPAGGALQPDPDLDLAVLRVSGTRPGQPCTPSRLGLDNLAPTLSRLTEAFIITMEGSELRTIRVERRARSIDSGRGTVFAVAPIRTTDRLAQGMSGSVVMAPDNAPLGMLIEVEPGDNVGIAVRFDAIKRAILSIETSPAKASSGAPALGEVRVLEGTTLDPAAGPGALVGAGGVWRVKAAGRRVRVLIQLPETQRMNRVTLAASGTADGDFPVGLEVATAAGAEAERFTSAAYCRADQGESPGLACRFAPRQVRVLRLTLAAPQRDAILVLGAVRLGLAPSQ
jgi:hypothetical protein